MLLWNRKLILILCALAAYGLKVSPARAQDSAPSPAGNSAAGYYLGGSLGQARTTLSIDLGKSTDMSLALLGGYQFNKTFGVEGGLLSLGRITNTAGIAGNTAGYGLAGLASAPLSRKVNGYVKLGMAVLTTAWDTSPTGTLNTTQTATGLNLGVGLRMEAAKNIDMRLGYDRYTVGSDDPAAGTVGNISFTTTFKF